MPKETDVRIVRKHLMATDQGQHGSASCGGCGAGVPDDATSCKACGALFGEHVVDAYPGGSDFP